MSLYYCWPVEEKCLKKCLQLWKSLTLHNLDEWKNSTMKLPYLLMQTYFIRTHHKNYIPKKTHEANILLNFKTFSGLSKIINKSQNIPGFSRTLLKFQDFPGSMGTLWSNISSTIQLSVWNLVKTCSFAGASSIKLVGMSTYVCVCVCVCLYIYIKNNTTFLKPFIFISF